MWLEKRAGETLPAGDRPEAPALQGRRPAGQMQRKQRATLQLLPTAVGSLWRRRRERSALSQLQLRLEEGERQHRQHWCRERLQHRGAPAGTEVRPQRAAAKQWCLAAAQQLQ